MKLIKRIASGIVLCQAPPWPCRAALPPISLEKLAARMKENEAALQSLRVEVLSTERRQQGAGSLPADPAGLVCRRTRTLYRMRKHFTQEYAESSSASSSSIDGPEGPIPPTRPQRITAYNGKVTSGYNGSFGTIDRGKPKRQLLGRVGLRNLYGISAVYSHWHELVVTDNRWEVRFLPTEMHDGRECYVLLWSVGGGGTDPPSAIRRCWVCPELGYSVVRWQDVWGNPASGYTPTLDHIYYDFAERVPGIWLPGRYECPIRSPRSVTYTYLGVNERLPRSEFVVRFPKGTSVRDSRFGKGWIPEPEVALGFGLPLIALVAAIRAWHHRRKPAAETALPDH